MNSSVAGRSATTAADGSFCFWVSSPPSPSPFHRSAPPIWARERGRVWITGSLAGLDAARSDWPQGMIGQSGSRDQLFGFLGAGERERETERMTFLSFLWDTTFFPFFLERDIFFSLFSFLGLLRPLTSRQIVRLTRWLILSTYIFHIVHALWREWGMAWREVWLPKLNLNTPLPS